MQGLTSTPFPFKINRLDRSSVSLPSYQQFEKAKSPFALTPVTRKTIDTDIHSEMKSANMSEDRIHHSVNVANVAQSLAVSHGLDHRQARRAGLLHDLFKESPSSKSLKRQQKMGITMPRWQMIPGLEGQILHGPLAAAHAKRKNLLSPEFADALHAHSNGSHKMTPEAKVVFLADNVGPDRIQTPAVKHARSIMHTDLDGAVAHLLADAHSKMTGTKFSRKIPATDRRLTTHRTFRYYNTGENPSSAILSGAVPAADVGHLGGIVSKKTLRKFTEKHGMPHPSQSGFSIHLDPHNDHVQEVFSKVFSRIDAETSLTKKSKLLSAALTKRNETHGSFRSFLPSIYPLIHDKYRDVFEEATKHDPGFTRKWKKISAFSELMDAGSQKNIDHLRQYFHDDWITGKGSSPMYKKDSINKSYWKFFDYQKLGLFPEDQDVQDASVFAKSFTSKRKKKKKVHADIGDFSDLFGEQPDK